MIMGIDNSCTPLNDDGVSEMLIKITSQMAECFFAEILYGKATATLATFQFASIGAAIVEASNGIDESDTHFIVTSKSTATFFIALKPTQIKLKVYIVSTSRK